MKTKIFLPLFFLSLLSLQNVLGQTYCMPTSGNQTVTEDSAMFYDSGCAAGNYSNNANGALVFCSTSLSCPATMTINSIALADAVDILRIYSGIGTGGTLLQTFQGPLNLVTPVQVISQDVTGCLTAQFQSNASGVAAGWNAKVIGCIIPVNILGVYNFPPSPACPLPFNTNLYVDGSTNGYLFTDSFDVYINFGDGDDTTVSVPNDSGQWFSASINHSYVATGQYSPQYIVTGPDGYADTLVNYNQIAVGDTCGNISGNIYIDFNGNCIHDGGDIPVPISWGPIQLLSGANVLAWAYPDSLGDYFFDVPTGLPYTIQVGNLFNSFTVLCPSSGNHIIATAPSSGNDFALTCAPGYDLIGHLTGAWFRPNQQSASINVFAYNTRCMPGSGQVRLVLDPLVTFTSSIPAPINISGDTLTWNFLNLVNNNNNYWWAGGFSAQVSVLTSASASIGDTVCFTVITEPVLGDANPVNNIETACYAVRNSWDPNDKAVNPLGAEPGARIPPDVNAPLTYTIRFQNTGNDTAYNVFIWDTLDSDLDLNMFRVISTSHAMDMDIYPGNAVKFSFNNIMLPDSGANQAASNGFISYTINQIPNLADGTLLTNTANIYFDFNPAIVTNTVLNTIDTVLLISTGKDIANETSIMVYPNPAERELIIQSPKFKVQRVEIMDVFGKVVLSQQQTTNHKRLTMDVSKLSTGIYFVRIHGEKENAVKKFIVKKVVKM